MSGSVCVLFDKNMDYVDRFLNYVKKNDPGFNVVGFTDGNLLEEYLLKEKVDILLLGEQELVQIGSLDRCEIVLLGDPDPYREGYRAIDKYRSMEKILADISEIFKELGKEKVSSKKSSGQLSELIGIYSFGYADKAEKFALKVLDGCGQKKALYMNLNRFSGYSEKFMSVPTGSLSDVIYYFVNGSERIRAAIRQATGQIGFYDVIVSPRDMEDLDLLKEDDWPAFFESLSTFSKAEVIVLDMAEAFRNLGKIFELCDKVYILYDREKDKAKGEDLKNYLLRNKALDLTQKLMEVDISKV